MTANVPFDKAVPSIYDAGEYWWREKGRLFDPDTSYVPIEDKQREIQVNAFVAGARHLYEAHLLAGGRALPPSPAAEPWTRVSDAKPAPHARYFVRRDEITFTATPCYGLHNPWWVPRVPVDGTGCKETDPIDMLDSDVWCLAALSAPAASGSVERGLRNVAQSVLTSITLESNALENGGGVGHVIAALRADADRLRAALGVEADRG